MKALGATRKGGAPLATTSKRTGGDAAFDLAEAAFRDADYVGARRLLQIAGSRGRAAAGTAALLEAQIARIEGDVEAWFAAADRAHADHPNPAGRLEALGLRALAGQRFGAAKEARRDIERLEAAALREPSGTLGMPTYYLAYDACLRGAYDDAQNLLERNVAAGASVALSLALLGRVEVRRDRYKHAGQLFFEAIKRNRQTGENDVRLQCKLLAGASAIASETLDLPLGRKLRRLYEEVNWPTALAQDRFDTLSSLRLLCLLEGDVPGAWLFSRECAVRAPSAAHRAIAETNLAAVSRHMGDAAAARFGFERAWETLRKERWGGADARARRALANFATEAASDFPAEARQAMALYDSLSERAGAAERNDEDRLIVACEEMASARVAEALGDDDRAVRSYERSLAGWNFLHFDMRAAMVTLDLARITRDARYRIAIEPVLGRAPKAWFVHRAPASIELLPAITPAEKLVLASLLEGKSARAIAQDLNRSVHTINNHTRKIFKAFGVTSRAAVLARCATLGITPSQVRRGA